MKITINVDVKDIEMANFLLSEAIEAAKNNPSFRNVNAIVLKDIEKAEKFRNALLDAFLNEKIMAAGN